MYLTKLRLDTERQGARADPGDQIAAAGYEAGPRAAEMLVERPHRDIRAEGQGRRFIIDRKPRRHMGIVHEDDAAGLARRGDGGVRDVEREMVLGRRDRADHHKPWCEGSERISEGADLRHLVKLASREIDRRADRRVGAVGRHQRHHVIARREQGEHDRQHGGGDSRRQEPVMAAVGAENRQRRALQLPLRTGDEMDIGLHGRRVIRFERKGADEARQVEQPVIALGGEALPDQTECMLLAAGFGKVVGQDGAPGIAKRGIDPVAEPVARQVVDVRHLHEHPRHEYG